MNPAPPKHYLWNQNNNHIWGQEETFSPGQIGKAFNIRHGSFPRILAVAIAIGPLDSFLRVFLYNFCGCAVLRLGRDDL